MPLPGSVVAAPLGVHGFDANSVLNRRICELAKARGFEFCIRYVSRQDVQPVGDLSGAEANVILGAGLALMSSVDGSRVASGKLTQWHWSGAVFCPAC
jgi:hypothetical protein